METKVKQLIATIKEKLGDALVGVVDRAKDEGQVAFCTTELDQGEDAPGKYNTVFAEAIKEHGLERCSFLPFPVQGKLVYTVAGLRRFA